MNNKLRALMLAALTVSGSAFATEHRTPYLSDRGPLRHSFKKLHKKKMNINTWSTVHSKEAHKAFMKHGTDTKELTALLFNKETFAFREIFPNAEVPLNSPNYNILMNVLRYSPKAKYFEYGATFGGQLDFPVWKDQKTGESKGRFGVRASVPVRTIEVERQDITPDNSSVDDALSKVIQSKVFKVQRKNDGAAADAGTDGDIMATAYRLDFVAAIPDSAGNSIIQTGDGAAGNAGFKVFGHELASSANDATPATALNLAKAAAVAGLVKSNAQGKPEIPAWVYNTAGGADFEADGRVKLARIDNQADETLAAVALGHVAVFTKENAAGNSTPAVVYTNMDFESDAAEQSWLIFRRGSDNGNDRRLVAGSTQAVDRMIQDRIRAVSQDPFEFLAANGFVFDSFKRSGLGDIDLDVFYEHEISEKLLAEVVLGVRFPTGSSKNSCNNPYRAIAKLGNGEHFEVKLGANASWECCKWLSMKADVSYNFVLEDKEKRAAVFEKSTVKNIGPCVDADVDWGYFIGRLDFQVHHPKTKSLSTVLGYEFYYKTEDHVTFKTKEAASWLGTVAQPVMSPLDNKLARANTESISHKGRFESRWKANQWLEIFGGGSMVFAGQNAFRDFDAHGGFNVRY